MSRYIGLAILAAGVAFDVLGCIGLVRLPDVYNRLQASTKCVTLGTCLLLLGAMVITGRPGVILKCTICIVFIALTSPTAAHALARGAHRAGVRLWEGSVADQYAEDREGMESGRVDS